MPTLGVFVTSENHLEKLIDLCRAAKKKGVQVQIFFTHRATLLTQDPRFQELEGLAHLSLCKVSFESHHLTPPVPGVEEKGFASQMRHGEMILDCDRYVVF